MINPEVYTDYTDNSSSLNSSSLSQVVPFQSQTCDPVREAQALDIHQKGLQIDFLRREFRRVTGELVGREQMFTGLEEANKGLNAQIVKLQEHSQQVELNAKSSGEDYELKMSVLRTENDQTVQEISGCKQSLQQEVLVSETAKSALELVIGNLREENRQITDEVTCLKQVAHDTSNTLESADRRIAIMACDLAIRNRQPSATRLAESPLIAKMQGKIAIMVKINTRLSRRLAAYESQVSLSTQPRQSAKMTSATKGDHDATDSTLDNRTLNRKLKAQASLIATLAAKCSKSEAAGERTKSRDKEGRKAGARPLNTTPSESSHTDRPITDPKTKARAFSTGRELSSASGTTFINGNRSGMKMAKTLASSSIRTKGRNREAKLEAKAKKTRKALLLVRNQTTKVQVEILSGSEKRLKAREMAAALEVQEGRGHTRTEGATRIQK